MTDLRPIYFAEARARLVGNRLRVYMALMEAGPSTPKELAAKMGWCVTSVRPRLTDMSPGHAEKCGSPVAVITTGIRRNGEHEFRALTAAQMHAAHERAEHERLLYQISTRAEPSGIAGQFRELKQLELRGV